MPLEKSGCGVDVGAAEVGDDAAARRALDEAELEEIRLVDVLDRLLLLAEGDGERGETDGPAAELDRDRLEQLAIGPLEADRVDLVEVERLQGDLERDRALVPHLGDVAYAAQDPVCDARRSAGADSDLVGRLVADVDAEDPGRAPHDQRELGGLVVAEAERHPEAVAERRRQEPGTRRRADERERRQVERERARGRPLADDDVEPEVLERRVEDLLDRAVQPVDLVDEEDVARLERGEDRGDVALALERRAGDLAEADAELAPDDLRQRRLAETGRAGEEEVVEGVAARLGSVERDRELLLDALLAHKILERLWAKRALELLPALLEHRSQHAGAHAAFLNATRTCSSIESESSTPA